jgi:hypothetical protein
MYTLNIFKQTKATFETYKELVEYANVLNVSIIKESPKTYKINGFQFDYRAAKEAATS